MAMRSISTLLSALRVGWRRQAHVRNHEISSERPKFTNSLKRAEALGKSYSFRRIEETNHVLQHIDLAAS